MRALHAASHYARLASMLESNAVPGGISSSFSTCSLHRPTLRTLLGDEYTGGKGKTLPIMSPLPKHADPVDVSFSFVLSPAPFFRLSFGKGLLDQVL